MATWLPAWEAAKKTMPARTSFDGSEDRKICGRVLGELQQARERILPAPDDNLDRLVDAWLHLAEDVMLGCPENWGEHTGFDGGYRELTRLALEVDLALRTSGGDALPESPPLRAPHSATP
jgi:hypothetical protein